MEMPNRFEEVKALIAPFKPFPQDEQSDPFRLELLKGVVIPGLNRLDSGRWGLITKTERPDNNIPCDVIAWKDTKDFLDVLTKDGEFWNLNPGKPEGRPDEWVWTAVDSPEPIPEPTPVPIVTDKDEILKAIADAKKEMLDAVSAVHERVDSIVTSAYTSLSPVVTKIMNSTKI